MAKRSEQRKRKKQEKHQRRRKEAKKRARAQAPPTTLTGWVKLASRGDFGPAWVSELHDDPQQPNALVTVVVTRILPQGELLSEVVLVDRACLGVKDAFVSPPQSIYDVEHRVAEMSERGDVLVRCEPAIAQSIVFHALDYAASLGFGPHRDFHRALLEPRPEPLLETPRARPERPFYCPGLEDRARMFKVVRKLSEAVGRGNFDFTLPGVDDLAERLDDDEWEEFDDGSRDFDDVEPDDWKAPVGWPLDEADAGGSPGRIDWRRACENVPWEDWLEEYDLLASDEYDYVMIEQMVADLREGMFLTWEAAIRREQGLPLSEVHTDALRQIGSSYSREDGEVERLWTIDHTPRTPEPWYQTLRRLVEHMGGLESMDPEDRAQLRDAIETFAGELSLPAGVGSVSEVLRWSGSSES